VRSPAGAAAPRIALGVAAGIGLFCGGTLGGIVGGRSACCALGRGTDGSGPGIGAPIGPGGGMPIGPGGGMPIGPGGGMCGEAIGPGGGMCGAAPIAGGDAIGPDGASIVAGTLGCDAPSALPQLRQNFMPGGFSPRHTLQILGVGNPWPRAGVCPNAGASELPQLRQNDDPGGLSWPHIEQRIGPLTLNPLGVSQQHRVSGMAPGRFATHAVSW